MGTLARAPTRPLLHTQTLEEFKQLSDYYAKLYQALDRERIKGEINTDSNISIGIQSAHVHSLGGYTFNIAEAIKVFVETV